MIPLIPIAYGGLALLIARGAYKMILKDNSSLFGEKGTKETMRVAVLGLQKSGKTTFQNYIRNTEKHGSTVARGEKVKEVTITHGEKTLKLLEAMDPSGSDEGLRLHLDDEINSSDKIFFFIKGDSFFRSDLIKKENRALFRVIVKKMGMENSSKKIWIFISHRDRIKSSSEKEVKQKVLDFLLKDERGDKTRYDKAIQKLELVNLTDNNDLERIKSNLFNWDNE